MKAKDLKVSGAKLKSVSGKGAKVTVNFKSKTKSATVNFVKGVVASSKLKKAVTRAQDQVADHQVHHQVRARHHGGRDIDGLLGQGQAPVVTTVSAS